MSLKGGMLFAGSSWIAFIEKEIPESGLLVDFLKGKPLSKLNGLSTSVGFHSVLKMKDYQYVNMVSRFIFCLF